MKIDVILTMETCSICTLFILPQNWRNTRIHLPAGGGCLVRILSFKYSLSIFHTKERLPFWIHMSSQPIPEVVQTEPEQPSWLNRSLQSYFPAITTETLLVALILVAALFTRFYMLGDRVMSHDETNHVVPSWELYQGQGYRVDPFPTVRYSSTCWH